MINKKTILKCVECNKELNERIINIQSCEQCGKIICSKCAYFDEKSREWYCQECKKQLKTTDLYLIELDETKYWEKKFLNKYKIKEITFIYIFDKNQHTCCCEMDYSYWLEPLYVNVIMEDIATDQERDKGYYEVEENVDLNPSYYNHYDIDNIIEKSENIVKLIDENFQYFSSKNTEDKKYAENFLNVKEKCILNHQL